MKLVGSTYMYTLTHCIHFLYHNLHHNVLVLDVDDGSYRLSLWSHEGGAKDHTQIAGLHEVALRFSSDA